MLFCDVAHTVVGFPGHLQQVFEVSDVRSLGLSGPALGSRVRVV